jgi:hypothetical protein|tara:strand:- start:295 stop:531 length:237 start_codon:yes stop_codon:yes gene_type:complete
VLDTNVVQLRIRQPQDIGLAERGKEIMAEKKVWDKKRPKSLGKSKALTAAQKDKARARAKRAGRKYPNLVDNMWAANQ